MIGVKNNSNKNILVGKKVTPKSRKKDKENLVEVVKTMAEEIFEILVLF